jgi:hypothetical protein
MAGCKIESRLTLHASTTNMYWVFIFIAVNGVLVLLYELFAMWRAGDWHPQAGVAACALLVFLGVIAYCERKARWLIAHPTGLEIIERSRTRFVPWNEVTIEELGLLGASPGSKRYYLELSDGYGFTFLGDPDAIARLPGEARVIAWKR